MYWKSRVKFSNMFVNYSIIIMNHLQGMMRIQNSRETCLGLYPYVKLKHLFLTLVLENAITDAMTIHVSKLGSKMPD